MQTGKIWNLRLVTRPGTDDKGDKMVIEVSTDFDGLTNSFYMEQFDTSKKPVIIANGDKSRDTDPNCIQFGDEISWDKPKILSRVVLWKGRTFRQRGYSFDTRGEAYWALRKMK